MPARILKQRDAARAVLQHLRGEPVDLAAEVARCRRDLETARGDLPAEGGAFEGRLLLEREVARLASEALAEAVAQPGADLRAALRAFGEADGPEWALRA